MTEAAFRRAFGDHQYLEHSAHGEEPVTSIQNLLSPTPGTQPKDSAAVATAGQRPVPKK